MMRDEIGDGRIAEHRRAKVGESETVAVQRSEQLQRRRGAQQAKRAVERQIFGLCHLRGASRLNRKKSEKVKFDAGVQDLRIDEPRTKIEQRPRPPARDRARKGGARGPTLEFRARDEAASPLPPPLLKTRKP